MSHCVYQNTLLDDIIHEHPLPRQLVKRAALEILDIIREGLLRDGSVRINNFGTFRIKRSAPRRGRNPKTGEPITIPPRNTVVFAPCKALREQLEARPVTAKAPEILHPTRSAAMPMAAQNTVEVRSVAQPPDPDETPPHSAEPAIPTALREERRDSAAPYERSLTGTTPVDVALPGEAANTTDATGPDNKPGLEATATEKKGRQPVWLYTGSAMLAIGLLLWHQLDEETGTATATAASQAPAEPPPSPLVTTQPVPRSGATNIGGQKAVALKAAPPNPVVETAATHPVEAGTATPAAHPVIADVHGPQDGDTFFAATAHTIGNGDSLWRLAERHYGDPLLWPHIYQANAEKITNPDLLRSGRTLTIPALQGPPSALSETDRRHIAAGYFMTYLYYRDHGHRDAFFALLEAKRYSAAVVEERLHELDLSRVERILLAQQQPLESPQPLLR